MDTPTDRQLPCPKKRKIIVGYTELTLVCELQLGHTTPRHRTEIMPGVVIFWEEAKPVVAAVTSIP